MIVAIGLLVSSIVLGQESPSERPPSESDIAAAVQRLGDDDFATREAASEYLWQAGASARAALEAAARSDDREVAIRASEVLEKVRLGIFADTPADIVQMIQHFHRGNLNQKRAVIGQLRQRKQQTTMFTLIRGETDKTIRQHLAREFITDSRKLTIELIAREDHAGAEEMLSWSAGVDDSTRSQRDYAAYLFVSGRLEQKIKELRASNEFQTDEDAVRLLATSLLVQGELREALDVAKLASDKVLQNDLLYRLEDWSSLAKEEQLPDGQLVEKLGAKAAYRMLAGDQAGFEAAVAEINALPAKNEEQGWLIGEALMTVGRWDDAATILRKWDRNSAFQLLAARLKFREALTFAGLEDPSQAATWYGEGAKATAANNQQAWQHFNLGLRMSRLLRDIGEDDAALELLATQGTAHADPDGLRAYNIFVETLRQGRRELALQRGAKLMAFDSRASSVMQELFGKNGTIALQWWQILRERSPREEPLVSLQRLETLLDATKPWPLPDTTLEEMAAQAAEALRDKESPRPAARSWAIAELAALRGNKELAKDYLNKSAKFSKGTPDVSALLRLGDLLAEEQAWSDAAAAYDIAWQRDVTAPLPLYLQGRAIVKSGDEERGRQLLRRAKLLPLADSQRRRELAEGLESRGLIDEAVEQRELVYRFGAGGNWAGNDDWSFRDAARRIGDHLETTDPRRAALLWERVLFGVMRTNSYFWDRADYVKMFSLVHKVRARGLLKEGKADAALRELDLAVAARQGDVQLVEQLLPELIAAGREAAAEKLFADMFARLAGICEEFPQSALHHNELAWLAARNDRRLDDALTHAQEAVRLRPEAANYIDTLAEVHFRRGDRDKAVALARQLIKREPQNKHFQEQLRRFQP